MTVNFCRVERAHQFDLLESSLVPAPRSNAAAREIGVAAAFLVAPAQVNHAIPSIPQGSHASPHGD
jgi:hypothetical protein